jgi:hypothetical protein
MAKKKKQVEGAAPILKRNCLMCNQEFEPKGPTNRICNRAPCRRRRSRPGMYTEAVNHPNKPDPEGLIRFPV